MTELKEITEKVDQLAQEIENLAVKLDKIMELLQVNHDECTRMGNHINFIENIYDSVKSPLNFICDKINIYKENNNGLIEEE